MKNRIMLSFWLLVICCTSAAAQGVLGFFDQQQTKIKDMTQQIILLETYSGAVKTGYNDARNGLGTIHELKNGTFSLHADYFSSLGQVNPAIAKDPKVKDIASFQAAINTALTNELQWQKSQAILTSKEISYLQAVFDNLKKEVGKNMDELQLILTPGRLQMTDDARIKRIEKIYEDMKDKYAFAQYFTFNSRAMAINRKAWRQNDNTIRQLY